ncbi:recombinase family protein [Wukongibacter baidiensis]|uniref:recombinase family protein n=1 Tax=Wukongibacter baidiensis TaxID=1723361 RepID=UPI003D7FA2F7
MKKVAIYIRVSTQEQAKEGYSIPAQRDKLLSFSKAKDWIVSNVYIDDGYTGTNLERPALKRMLEHMDDIDLVLVYKLDRLSRSQRDVLYLVEDIFLENNVDFVSVLESFDTATPFGRAMLGILAVFSQLERDTIVERSKLGKERRAKEGKWRGGPVPLGYDYIDGSLMINEYEANIIRLVFQKYIAGLGMDSICKELNSKGYRSKHSAEFTVSKIKTYLNNPLYVGMIPYKDMQFNGSHESIIDIETFNLAKSLMKKRSISYRKTSDSLLGGLLICGKCGSKMFRRNIRDYQYYICYTYHGSPSHMVTAKSCNLGYINASKLEAQIISQLGCLPIDKSILTPFIKDILELNTTSMDKTSLNGLENELTMVNTELSRWYDAYGKGHMNFTEVDNRIELALKKKKNIQEQIASLSQLKNEAQSNDTNADQLKLIIENFDCIWENATLSERKIILKGFIKSIIVYKNTPPTINFLEE